MVRAADALPALRAVLAAERAALAAVLASAGADDPLAAEFRGAIAATERTRASVAADPLRSRTMSPVGTVVPSTRRAIAAAKGLTDELCARS